VLWTKPAKSGQGILYAEKKLESLTTTRKPVKDETRKSLPAAAQGFVFPPSPQD
jgi:hypothetical protein